MYYCEQSVRAVEESLRLYARGFPVENLVIVSKPLEGCGVVYDVKFRLYGVDYKIKVTDYKFVEKIRVYSSGTLRRKQNVMTSSRFFAQPQEWLPVIDETFKAVLYS